MTTDYPIGARVAAGDTTPTSAALNALLEERDTAVTDLRDAIDELAALHVERDKLREDLRRVTMAHLMGGALWDDLVRDHRISGARGRRARRAPRRSRRARRTVSVRAHTGRRCTSVVEVLG